MWVTGLLILVVLYAVSFFGYICAWGLMSYWGGTVILSLLSVLPGLTVLLLGDTALSSVTVRRLIVYHEVCALVVLLLLVVHLVVLHSLSSTPGLGITNNSTSNTIGFTNSIAWKDI